MENNSGKKAHKHKVLIDGPITPRFISEQIEKHSAKKNIGAHSIFLGQVRNDEIEGKEVEYIDYTAYSEMAEAEFHKIREESFEKFNLTCLHIFHSTGKINAGEVCLFVFTSSKHRNDATAACNYIVEELKKRVPVFGKEICRSGDSFWKINK